MLITNLKDKKVVDYLSGGQNGKIFVYFSAWFGGYY